jgi:hypothetical protein
VASGAIVTQFRSLSIISVSGLQRCFLSLALPVLAVVSEATKLYVPSIVVMQQLHEMHQPSGGVMFSWLQRGASR